MTEVEGAFPPNSPAAQHLTNHYRIDRFGCVCSPCGQSRWQFENSSYVFRSKRCETERLWRLAAVQGIL